MKPQFEQVTVAPGESWTLLWRELPELPFLWHYHPEFELTLTLNAHGQRYVGDSLEDFEPGDLVLVGPNQPHTWAAAQRPDESQPMLAIVVWFTAEWFGRLVENWPELATLSNLAEGAGRGLHFSPAAVARAQPLMLSLRELDPAQRLPLLLQILTLLSRDGAVKTLATHAFSPAGDKVQDRMSKVLNLLHEHAIDTPSIEQLADAAALSVGAFHRFFKRHTGMTVLDYVAQLRIGIACQLLITGDQPIKLVAAEAGYSNAAHFNRQFLERKKMTPRQFRASYRTRSGTTVSGHRS
jgi:AraC-like DNA-binding protein/mannose-6-phosphate isomerase-like protein (cupin superfamily)